MSRSRKPRSGDSKFRRISFAFRSLANSREPARNEPDESGYYEQGFNLSSDSPHAAVLRRSSAMDITRDWLVNGPPLNAAKP